MLSEPIIEYILRDTGHYCRARDFFNMHILHVIDG